MLKGDDTIYCDWCGKKPYHISMYKDTNCDEELFLCEDCFNLTET